MKWQMKKKILTVCMTLLMGLEMFGAPLQAKAAGETDLTESSEEVQDGGFVALNAKNFPDANFRACIAEQYDKDGDGYVKADEVYGLDCSFRGITSLQGINVFKNLIRLQAQGNSIKGTVNLENMKNFGAMWIDNPVDCVYKLKGTYLSDFKGFDGFYVVVIYVKKDGEVVDTSRFQGINNKLFYEYTNKKCICNLKYNMSSAESTDWCTSLGGNVEVRILGEQEGLETCGYKTHVQTYGWQNWTFNGKTSGTTGQAKRLEGICIALNDFYGSDLGIRYTTHVQTYGWLPWSANGEMSGTEGEAKRLEAIKIQLTGNDAKKYDIYYRVHAQSYGWLGWAKNGESAGTAGMAKRLEGIQIKLVKKGSTFDRNQDGVKDTGKAAYYSKDGNTKVDVPGEDTISVMYQTHVQSYGWQSWKRNGEVAGTVGQGKRLEAIRIRLMNSPNQVNGLSDAPMVVVGYRTHVQTYGWEKDYTTGGTSGTTGKGKRLEAIEITMGSNPDYDIYYRVHAQTFGWLGWVKNGEPAGTEGLGKRLEGIQIVVVKKGQVPPDNYKGVVSNQKVGFIKK